MAGDHAQPLAHRGRVDADAHPAAVGAADAHHFGGRHRDGDLPAPGGRPTTAGHGAGAGLMPMPIRPPLVPRMRITSVAVTEMATCPPPGNHMPSSVPAMACGSP